MSSPKCFFLYNWVITVTVITYSKIVSLKNFLASLRQFFLCKENWRNQEKIRNTYSKPQIRRFQEYFNHIYTLIACTTLQFLQFWYQNGVNILFLIVKPIEVTPGFILKVMKKFARWRRCWNIWNLSLKPKISLLVVRCHEFNEYQKNRQDLRNSDLEVFCINIQPKLKNLKNSNKNQSFFMVSRGSFKFIQYWLNIRALTFICRFFFDFVTPLAAIWVCN